jgi:NAD(P)-dependent dehydrogenase (short-subunit alcohol dehydrogenase family)
MGAVGNACAIVTGHSRGLGAALVDALLGQGLPVLALARHARGSADARLREVALDLSDAAALQRWLAAGELDAFVAGCARVLLINNAGTLGPVGPLSRQDPALVGAAIALNVAAPLQLSAALAARVLPRGAELRVLHVSSGAARNAYAGWSVYCASKAALDQHARAVTLDGVAGLRIASVAPGVIDTAMQAQIRATDAADFPQRERFEALRERGQLLAPADVATRLLSYLQGDAFGAQPVVDLRDLG